MATERMDDETLRSVVKGLLRDAIDYSEELGEDRSALTESYNGEKLGNEDPDRSQIVTREVRDAIEVAKPALMRIFFGNNRVLEYAPEGPEDVQGAEEATSYTEHVLKSLNNGYMGFLSAFEDALVRRTGVFKTWWEESEKPVQTEHEGLTEEDLQLLEMDDEVTEIVAEPSGEEYPAEVPEPGTIGPDGEPAQPPPPVPLFNATVTRVKTKGRIRVVAVPVEELVISRRAKDVETSELTGHYREVTLSELREMGYTEEQLEDLTGDESIEQELEKEVRSVGTTETDYDDGSGADGSLTRVMYGELWVTVDYDGDGIAETRRICVAGTACKVLENTLAEEAQIAILTPGPVAHQAIGRSLAELAHDIQNIKTMVLRNVIDSLANSINPDVAAVEGEVNMKDLMSREIGRIIRLKRPGMLEYLSTPYNGDKAYPLLQYMDTLVESRTGMNEAAQGLNADALQSTAKSAIDNATQSAQSRIEFIARTFIEGGIKRLFKLILRLAHQHIDRPTMVRINRRFTPIDPRAWNADMDVDIVMPLGDASLEQRLNVLQLVAEKQEMAIQMGGLDNPLAGLREYRNTLADITKLAGLVDANRHFKDPNDPASYPEPKPPEPSPEMLLAQSEMQKAQAEIEHKRREYELDVWKAVQEDDRARDKMMAELMLEAQKSGAEVDMNMIRAEVERQREGHDHMVKVLHEINADKQAQAQAQAQAAQARQPQGGATQ